MESLDESSLKEMLRNILLSRVEDIADWFLAPLGTDNIDGLDDTASDDLEEEIDDSSLDR